MNILTTMAPGLVGQRRPARADACAAGILPLQRAAVDRHTLAPGMGPLNDERVPACRTVGRSAAAAQT